MKLDTKSTRTWKVAATIAAIASIPTSIFAYYSEWFAAGAWAHIGQGYSSTGYYSCTSGLLIVGGNNNAPQYFNTNSLIAGHSLNLYNNDSIILGRWNKNTLGDDLFVVGNGTSASTTQNEMEILKDGTIHMGDDGSGSYAFEIDADGETIRIKPQGDIDMGIYSGS